MAVLLILFETMLPRAAQAQAGDRESLSTRSHSSEFSFDDSLFGTVDLDTGWVPAGAAIQVRFELNLAGSTQVQMETETTTHWPDPIEVEPVGAPGTGYFMMNYGIELRGRLRFDIEVAGIRYRWEGDLPIPGVPEDLRFFDEADFDPLLLGGLPAPARLEDATEMVSIVGTDALGSIISIPGVGGGLNLLASGELVSFYQTDRVEMTSPAGPAPLTTPGEFFLALASGPDYGSQIDLGLHPEGTVSYEGTLVLTPSLYLSFLGTRRSLSLARIEIPIADFDSNIIFDDDTWIELLPNLKLETSTDESGATLDFGAIAVGNESSGFIDVRNDGDAAMWVQIPELTDAFRLEGREFVLPARSRRRLPVVFFATSAGPLESTVEIQTNDPDTPVAMVLLTASGLFEPDAGADAGGPDSGADSGTPNLGGAAGGACECSSTGRGPSPVWLVLILALALRRRTI